MLQVQPPGAVRRAARAAARQGSGPGQRLHPAAPDCDGLRLRRRRLRSHAGALLRRGAFRACGGASVTFRREGDPAQGCHGVSVGMLRAQLLARPRVARAASAFCGLCGVCADDGCAGNEALAAVCLGLCRHAAPGQQAAFGRRKQTSGAAPRGRDARKISSSAGALSALSRGRKQTFNEPGCAPL